MQFSVRSALAFLYYASFNSLIYLLIICEFIENTEHLKQNKYQNVYL